MTKTVTTTVRPPKFVSHGVAVKTIGEAVRRPRFWGLLLALWSVPGLVGAVIYMITLEARGTPISWPRALILSLPFWYLWALLTPAVFWLGQRFRLDEPGWWKSVLVHVMAAPASVFLHLMVALACLRHFYPGGPDIPSFWLSYRRVVQGYMEYELLVYGAILGLGYAYDYYRRWREDALRASQLEARLATAQLQALRMQLQPHFLFNTLHVASSLMDQDVRAARRMLARLADLLRRTLETEGKQEVPLVEELENLELYLDIERERFADRLEVELLVEHETLNALVPSLVLQPLAENAVRHGIARRSTGGHIRVRARRHEEWLHLSVEDDGRSEGNGGPIKEGVGLRNTRSRLAQLYGERQEFDLGYQNGEGFRVEMRIPFREASRGETSPREDSIQETDEQHSHDRRR